MSDGILRPDPVNSPTRQARRPARHDHVVEFYETEQFLADTVTDFVGPGLHDGGAAIVVATPAHRYAFEEALRHSGIDVERAIDADRYLAFDAAELLARFMVDGVARRPALRGHRRLGAQARRSRQPARARLRRDGRAAVGGRRDRGGDRARGLLERPGRDARVRAAVRLSDERLQGRRERRRVRADLRHARDRDPQRELLAARRRRREAPRGRPAAAGERRPARRGATDARPSRPTAPPAAISTSCASSRWRRSPTASSSSTRRAGSSA